MPTRQRLVSLGIPSTAIATIVTAALLSPWSPGGGQALPQPDAPGTKHSVDLVFAVDTTGSMGGLLDGAKRTVWSIATHIQRTDPNADIRIGLVAYRDVGDEYITRTFALTTDLDAAFAELSQYRADGGGDTPEDVDAALNDALAMSWRSQARKLVFVVGDAPPASRGNVPTFDVLAKQAAARGITINAIRCGWDADTASTFQTLASLGGGEFSTISQDGGVQQIATPYDARLAELSARIDSTAVIMGEGRRNEHARKMAATAAAPAAAKADRAEYYGMLGKGGGGARDSADLVDGIATGAMSLDSVNQGDLPAELRNKDKAAIADEVAKRAVARKAAQAEIKTLSKQRAQYLEANAAPGDAGFDAKVKATVTKQLAK